MPGTDFYFTLRCGLGTWLVAALCASSPAWADQKYTNVWKGDISVITEAGPTGYVRIRDARSGYYHVENGTLQTGPLMPNWQSALWKVESGADYVRFQNQWKPEVYLHTETGSVTAGKVLLPGWLSARWTDAGAAMKDVGLSLRARFQCTDPGDDGCSAPGKDNISEDLKRVFKPACAVHDRCYASPWRLAGYPGFQGQRRCDAEFDKNITAICSTQTAHLTCWTGRVTFVETVKDWGFKAFDNGQAKAERSCVDKSSRINNGAVTFFNSGGFLARVELAYALNGKQTSVDKDIALAVRHEWVIPAGATGITVAAYSYTGLVWDPRKLIVKEDWGNQPQSKCFKLYNTTLNPKYNNICDMVDR